MLLTSLEMFFLKKTYNFMIIKHLIKDFYIFALLNASINLNHLSRGEK